MDKKGEGTLAILTKVDKLPEGLLEKVIGDDVHIGLGYVCVRNQIDDKDRHMHCTAWLVEMLNHYSNE